MTSPKLWARYSLGIAVTAGLVVYISSTFRPLLTLGICLFLISSLVPLFFRDPERRPPAGEGLLLSPADGRISEVDGGEVGIFMSLWDVHVVRSPIRGRVVSVEERKGGHLPAFLRSAGRRNFSTEVVLEGREGRVGVRMIAGALARKVDTWVREGEEVERGGRIGMIRFGSRVEVVLPRGVRISVRVGERVRAGETALGVL